MLNYDRNTKQLQNVNQTKGQRWKSFCNLSFLAANQRSPVTENFSVIASAMERARIGFHSLDTRLSEKKY